MATTSPLTYTALDLTTIGRADLIKSGWDAYTVTHRASGAVVGTVFGTPRNRPGKRWWSAGTITGDLVVNVNDSICRDTVGMDLYAAYADTMTVLVAA